MEYFCSSLSTFNVGVKSKNVEEVCGDENNTFSEKQVKCKSQDYYYSRIY
jgi:hypothetical protein